MVSVFSYLKGGCKGDKWKWVLNLEDKENLLLNSNNLLENISNINMLETYGIYKLPKSLPCRKKCNINPWCLAGILKECKSSAALLTEQLRDMTKPIGLQNTANTCWINSALQALFHLNHFRNCINSIDNFQGEDSLNSLEYLLQAMFVEMELHKHMALACSADSVFEKLAIFVTKEIMQKDQDYEVLKCVSEFIENTIDNLLGNPRTGPRFSSVFKTTMYRIARWNCSSCKKEHVLQLPSDTCYTMAAYVSADECPLDQCILDLQTETQTGVSLVCDGDGGCGATVKTDRVVTPQVQCLPSLLIIRNNSLLHKEIKRRLHVVYPETLDLSRFTCSKMDAAYTLRAVIYHHGHWIKHFSAHVKTEDGVWYNFNDEKVSPLVGRSGNCPPLETHKDYFSLPNVANKYRNRSKQRVSRGAFIWIYEKDSNVKNHDVLQPSNTVLDYVLTKQINKQTVDLDLLEKIKSEKEAIYEKLAIESPKEDHAIISHALLSAWFASKDLIFTPQPSLLAEGLCHHMKFDPLNLNSFKCIRKSQVDVLFNSEYGIHSNSKIPSIFTTEEAFCKHCVSKHAHHILFREKLKELQKKSKKEASKVNESETTFVGTTTLGNWDKLAINAYIKDSGLEDVDRPSEDAERPTDEDIENNTKAHAENEIDKNNACVQSSAIDSEANEEDSKEPLNNFKDKENGVNSKGACEEETLSYFNEDIVCCHNMIDPKVPGVWISNVLTNEMKKLCVGMIHPATYQTDFDICPICKTSMTKTIEICSDGVAERKKLYHLFAGRKRPHTVRDAGKPLFLLSKEFLNEWRSFIRMCAKNDQEISKPAKICNSNLICKHDKLKHDTSPGSSLFDFAVVVNEEEWNCLLECYPFDFCIETQYSEDGTLTPTIGTCDVGCVEEESVRLYEDQFNFDYELINVRQVNSESDVPIYNTVPDNHSSDEILPKKKPRLATLKDNSESGSSSLRPAAQRLVRASKAFSSSDTIKDIQLFIAERTGIWPLLQTLWLSGGKEHGPEPLLLTDKYRSVTLKTLRIKPGDTIYFRAAVEDLEIAAGDGETEYSEILEQGE